MHLDICHAANVIIPVKEKYFVHLMIEGQVKVKIALIASE
jgi:hypothetical protein